MIVLAVLVNIKGFKVRYNAHVVIMHRYSQEMIVMTSTKAPYDRYGDHSDDYLPALRVRQLCKPHLVDRRRLAKSSGERFNVPYGGGRLVARSGHSGPLRTETNLKTGASTRSRSRCLAGVAAACRRPTAAEHRIEIALGNGRVVRVGANVDIDSLHPPGQRPDGDKQPSLGKLPFQL